MNILISTTSIDKLSFRKKISKQSKMHKFIYKININKWWKNNQVNPIIKVKMKSREVSPNALHAQINTPYLLYI